MKINIMIDIPNLTGKVELLVTHEVIVNERSLLTAPKVWWEILQTHPEIVAMTYATYPPQSHGTSARYQTETEYTIRTELAHGLWPTFGVGKALCAISSLVGTDLEEGERKPVYLFNPFCHPYRMDYDILQLNHRAFPFLDFEWPNTASTQVRILDSLQRFKDPWFLFDSGGSYHLVVDKLLVPIDLPKYWGYLINIFTLHQSVRNKEQMIGIGNYLCGGWDKPRDLISLGKDILSNFGHIDDVDFGKSIFIIDMRHLAHSLIELAGWLDGKDEPFCFLRVSNSPKYPFPPVLIARGDKGKMTIYNYPHEQTSPTQLHLNL